MEVLYEDNHIIVVSKSSSEIVQGDKTGDVTLSEMVAEYLRKKYDKKGNVFVGVAHRLDRPVSGVVVLAKTSKALARLNDMFRNGMVDKRYLAIVKVCPPKQSGELVNYLVRNEKQNKSFAYDREIPKSKKAVLKYQVIADSVNYHMLAIKLETGRHHQIRCQLAKIGCPIKGDMKYGAERSNTDGSISLHSYMVTLEHPVSHKLIQVTAPLPNDALWQSFNEQVKHHFTQESLSE